VSFPWKSSTSAAILLRIHGSLTLSWLPYIHEELEVFGLKNEIIYLLASQYFCLVWVVECVIPYKLIVRWINPRWSGFSNQTAYKWAPSSSRRCDTGESVYGSKENAFHCTVTRHATTQTKASLIQFNFRGQTNRTTY
jgi:hypothetical protein